MSIKVIGISGKSGSGKDFISQNYLRPRGYYQWSLAWHFKVWTVGKGLATHEEVFYTKPPHVRKELQLEGTERGRMIFGDDVWCNTAKEWFTILNEQWGINKFVIPDVRFPNEIDFVKSMGGSVIRIHAPMRVDNNALSIEARNHISETALDTYMEFDYFVHNNPDYSHTVEAQINDILLEIG